jgi:hypothetical protein
LVIVGKTARIIAQHPNRVNANRSASMPVGAAGSAHAAGTRGKGAAAGLAAAGGISPESGNTGIITVGIGQCREERQHLPRNPGSRSWADRIGFLSVLRMDAR